MKIRKKLFILIILVMIIGMSSCGETETTDEPEIEQPTYDVQMEIEFDGNLLFSKYDVDILVDDIEYLNLDHNVDGTFSVELEEGEHTLTVKKEDDGNVDGNVNFIISEDATLKYRIYCSKDKVEIEDKTDEEVASEEVEKPKDSEELVSEDDTAKDKLEDTEEPSEVSEDETSTSSSDMVLFEGYTLLKVNGGSQSGKREANVVVDIGYDDREYWAFTNQFGQLVKVIADEIILQDECSEPVNDNGRYYPDEAKVPGVESSTLDEGHVIADCLGGVANAYNITPQNSTLNRHGDQAYMEKAIRDAGGCTDFTAIITYPNTETQIPSHYEYTYTLMGNVITDSFDNVNPDEANELIEEETEKEQNQEESQQEEVKVEIVSLDKRAEYVIIENKGIENIDISGWAVISVKGQQKFTFPSGYILKAGQQCKLTSGDLKGTGDFTMAETTIWNNSSSDPAELYNDNGVLIDRFE